MKPSTVLVEDGTPAAAALGEWLSRGVDGVVRITAIGSADVSSVLDARRAARRGERIVGLSDAEHTATLNGREAMRVARGWLRGLGPFEQRLAGADALEEGVRRKRPDAGALVRLRAAIAAGSPGASGAGPTPRPIGRPRGTTRPLRGVGFDLAVRLLLHPDDAYTERALADAVRRSTYGVHRALVALDEAGLVRRRRGDIRAHCEPLADALRRDWVMRHGSGRAGRGFARLDARPLAEKLREFAQAPGVDLRLASASALGAHLTSAGPTTLYGSGLTPEHLSASGLREVHRAAPDLIVWEPPERAVLAEPEDLNGLPTTNAVVTWLDAMASGEARLIEVASELWERR